MSTTSEAEGGERESFGSFCHGISRLAMARVSISVWGGGTNGWRKGGASI